MRIYSDVNRADNFDFWSGAVDTVDVLTVSQLDTIWEILECDVFPNGADETEINDFFWFERDFIADLLGFEDFEALERYNAGDDLED